MTWDGEMEIWIETDPEIVAWGGEMEIWTGTGPEIVA